MKQMIIICALCFCRLFALYAQPHQAKQKAWEITTKTYYEALPGASKEEIKAVKEINARQPSTTITDLLTDNMYRDSKNGTSPFTLIASRYDSSLYYASLDSIARFSFNTFRKELNGLYNIRISNLQLLTDSTKYFFGLLCHKFTCKMISDNDTTNIKAWYSTLIPSWQYQGIYRLNWPGYIIEETSIQNHIKIVYQATSIKQLEVDSNAFSLPKGYHKVADNFDTAVVDIISDTAVVDDLSTTTSETLNDSLAKVQKNFLSILNVIVKPDSIFQSASPFRFGFARLSQNDKYFYIDAARKYAFDDIINEYHPVAKVTPSEPGYINIDKNDSVMMLIVSKKGKVGLVGNNANWALQPGYDNISPSWNIYLTLMQNGKTGYADTWGKILLPAKFDSANIMDGNYFDVKTGGKWGVYSAEQKKLVIPAQYDGFDYCGGCGAGVEYAYAEKNGKWGVINFQDSVLAPFEYEHPGHWGMRGDDWVTSFQKNGKDVAININSQKVFASPEYSDMNVIGCVLSLKKNGKYGLADGNGKQLLPFEYDDISDPYYSLYYGPYIKICKNKKCGIADNSGRIIIPPYKYDDVVASYGYFIVWKNKVAGIADTSGKEILSPQYDIDGQSPMVAKDSSGKKEILFETMKNNLTGFFNVTTGAMLKPAFSSVGLAYTPDSAMAFVEVRLEGKKSDDKVGLYSLQGKEIIPCLYSDFKFLNNRLVVVEKGERRGMYDLVKTKQVLPSVYKNISSINSRYLLLNRTINQKKVSQLWDQTKDTTVFFPYQKATLSNDSNTLIVSDKNYTYLYSFSKQKVISKRYPVIEDDYYESIEPFDHGLAKVHDSEKSGYINLNGQEVIPVKYDRATMNKNGFIILAEGNWNDNWKYGYADSTGRMITPVKYLSQYYNGDINFQNGNFLLIGNYNKEDGRELLGYVNLGGNEIVSPEYDEVTPSVNGNGFIVKRNNRFGVLDKNGKVIMPPVLDNVFTIPTDAVNALDIQFPVLCQKGNSVFYITSSGAILPFYANGPNSFYEMNNY